MTQATSPVICIAVLAFQGKNVLLVRHEESAGHVTGVYGLPSGRVEAGESLVEAAKRELSEETGLQTDAASLVAYPGNVYEALIKRKSGEELLMQMTVFICTSFTGELRVSEETTPEWIGVDSLSQYQLLPNVSTAITQSLVYFTKQV